MMTTRKADGARRYRSAIPLTGGSVGAVGFFLLGADMVVYGSGADVGATAVGVFVMAIAGVAAALVGTTFAELTPAGLVYRFNFRRRMIPWASIESFRVSRGPGTGPWSG